MLDLEVCNIFLVYAQLGNRKSIPMKTMVPRIVAYCVKKGANCQNICTGRDAYTLTVINAESEHALSDSLTFPFYR